MTDNLLQILLQQRILVLEGGQLIPEADISGMFNRFSFGVFAFGLSLRRGSVVLGRFVLFGGVSGALHCGRLYLNFKDLPYKTRVRAPNP